MFIKLILQKEREYLEQYLDTSRLTDNEVDKLFEEYIENMQINKKKGV